jgi:hypothetical protein
MSGGANVATARPEGVGSGSRPLVHEQTRLPQAPGHFVGTPTCTDIGAQVQCTGKVAGLGGTTFTINVSAAGTATVECTNPAGNVAPGQTFATEVAGSTGPVPTPRNGQFRFSVTTTAPTAPADSCPNPQWTANVTDVAFTTATITLLEDSTESDTITVPVTS